MVSHMLISWLFFKTLLYKMILHSCLLATQPLSQEFVFAVSVLQIKNGCVSFITGDAEIVSIDAFNKSNYGVVIGITFIKVRSEYF